MYCTFYRTGWVDVRST